MVSQLVFPFLSFPLDLALTMIHYLVISSPMCHLSPGLDPLEKVFIWHSHTVEYNGANNRCMLEPDIKFNAAKPDMRGIMIVRM